MVQLGRGLFDAGISVLDAEEVPGTLIHNFLPRSCTETYQSDTANIDAADARQEDLQFNERYEMSLEVAGLPLAALGALEGVTVATSGSGATLATWVTKNVTANQRPYVRFVLQQKDKTGGATEYTFPRVSASGSPTLNQAQGQYLTPTIPLIATPATKAVTGPPAFAVGDLYKFNQKATYAALS
jgi:hypothetical protein